VEEIRLRCGKRKSVREGVNTRMGQRELLLENEKGEKGKKKKKRKISERSKKFKKFKKTMKWVQIHIIINLRDKC
jgi:hypothetical protein